MHHISTYNLVTLTPSTPDILYAKYCLLPSNNGWKNAWDWNNIRINIFHKHRPSTHISEFGHDFILRQVIDGWRVFLLAIGAAGGRHLFGVAVILGYPAPHTHVNKLVLVCTVKLELFIPLRLLAEVKSLLWGHYSKTSVNQTLINCRTLVICPQKRCLFSNQIL